MRPQMIGSAKVGKVVDYDRNPVPLDLFMPGATADDLAALADWYVDPSFGPDPESSILDLSWHTFVIEVAGRVILVDTGLGNGKARGGPVAFCDRLATGYLGRLAAVGIEPDDVDAVICTHLHFDHVGWNTIRDGTAWRPTFPNATYYFPQGDVIHFGSCGADPAHAPAFADSVQPVIDTGQARFVDPGEILLDEQSGRIRVEAAPGHSPGNMVVWLESAGRRAVFTGDVIHHPIQLVRPEIHLAVEEDPCSSIATRCRLLDEITDQDVLAFPAHFRGTSAGRVVTNAAGPGRAWVFVS